ncbi:MAG: inorganic diphosphatase [Candidatus Dormibacteraeota bacterium]|nr:inorganic diphosphatase [Candidatus Dormibacteraeota bacterium]
MKVEVVVEVPKGSRNKYEADHDTGAIWLDRELFTATRYPADYGFLPQTLAEDGDPLDVLVIVDEPTFPGCHMWCRPIGIFWMSDEHGRDAKLLAVPEWDLRMAWRDIHEVPEYMKREIHHFFDIYKDLEPDKVTETLGWADRDAAEAEIHASRERFTERHAHSGAGPAH